MASVPDGSARALMQEPSIGIDLGGTKISGALLVDGLQPWRYLRQQTPRGDYPATVQAIVEVVSELESAWQNESGAAQAPLPIGIGTPGVCERATGRMSHCNSTWLNDRPLSQDLEKYFTRKVTIANDADCFALSQSQIQPGLERGLIFGVILGTGVGGGWVHDGALRPGPNQLAGEWGHTPLPYFQADTTTELGALEQRLETRNCYCGRQNCVETFLSGPGLLTTHETLWGRLPALRSAQDLINASGSERDTTVALYCAMLARTLAQVINSVDPDIIILGGGLSNFALLYDALPRDIPVHLFSRMRLATPILPPVGGDDAGVIGAALLCERGLT